MPNHVSLCAWKAQIFRDLLMTVVVGMPISKDSYSIHQFHTLYIHNIHTQQTAVATYSSRSNDRLQFITNQQVLQHPGTLDTV